jgi:hypothetical protein
MASHQPSSPINWTALRLFLTNLQTAASTPRRNHKPALVLVSPWSGRYSGRPMRRCRSWNRGSERSGSSRGAAKSIGNQGSCSW